MPIDGAALLTLVVAGASVAATTLLAFRTEPATRRHAANSGILLLLALPLLVLVVPRSLAPVGVEHPEAFAWLGTPLPGWLILGWALGSVAKAGYYARTFRAESRAISRLPVCADAEITHIVARLRKQMGLTTDVVVKLSVSRGPCTFVGREAFIVVPKRSLRWPGWVLEAALAHELVHIQRGDHRFLIALHAVQAVYWFLPWLNALERNYLRAVEQSCDDRAAQLGEVDEQYALALGVIARIESDEGHRRNTDIGQRIARFLRPRDSIARKTAAQIAVATTAALAFVSIAVKPIPVAAPASPLRSASIQSTDARASIHTTRRITHLAGTLHVIHRAMAPDAIYPGSALLQNVEGSVDVEYWIGRDGSVVSALVRRSDHPLLEAAALRAVYSTEWTVEADLGGAGAQAVVQEQFRFRLQPSTTETVRL